MQIIYKIGDAIDGEEAILVHGCNQHGVMGAGFAKAVRERLPFAYEAYKIAWPYCLGQVVWAIRIIEGERPRIVGNAITQEHYGNEAGRRYVDYEAVREAMRAVDNFVVHAAEHIAVLPRDKEGRIAVAMPMIGAGRGGGEWWLLEMIIQEESQHFQPVVYRL